MSETPINRDLARSQRNESEFAPVGNNIYELTLKALNLTEKALIDKRILDIGSADAQLFARGGDRNGLDIRFLDCKNSECGIERQTLCVLLLNGTGQAAAVIEHHSRLATVSIVNALN